MVVPSPFVCTRVLGEEGLVTRARTAIVHGTPRLVQLEETPRLTERPSCNDPVLVYSSSQLSDVEKV